MSVYFARESLNGWIKIGSSINPKQRVKSMRSSTGPSIGRVELLKVIDGSFDEEKFYQGLLKVDRSDPSFSGEWFLPSADVMHFVDMPVGELNRLTEQWKDARLRYGRRVKFVFNGKNVVAKVR